MTVRFSTIEQAWIHAGQARARGHHAMVLDEHIGMLWTPLVTQGFRVVISEETIPEDADPDPKILWLPQGSETGVIALMGAVALGCLFHFLRIHQAETFSPALTWSHALPLIGVLVPVLLIPGIEPTVRALRNPLSVIGFATRAFVVGYLLLTGAFYLLALGSALGELLRRPL